MKFVLKPSLEHMALVKIGISLWTLNDVRTLISKLSSCDMYSGEWEKITQIVIKKVPQLPLPQLLKEKVFGVIKPVGMQIFEWMQYYRKYDRWIMYQHREFQSRLDLDLPLPLPAELCWTPQGTVDRKRTAEVLVTDENLDISIRYCLACDYCLEDDTIRFWNRLPEDLKNCDWDNFPVVSFWSDHMKRGGAGYISDKLDFYISIEESNKIAAKYFQQKLTPQERKESLKGLTVFVEDADVLCYLISDMDSEQQMEVFKHNPCKVLQSFLKWPWQSFFIVTANCMWDFLSADHFNRLLIDIVHKIEEGYKDWNYQELFKEFWHRSPSTLKSLFIDEIGKSWLLPSLFRIKDKENIRLILKEVTLTAKSKLIYSKKIDYYIKCSFHENEWDILEFCIQEFLPSKNEMLKFKKEFEKRWHFKECSETEKLKWNQLFSFSDDSICKYNKRRKL